MAGGLEGLLGCLAVLGEAAWLSLGKLLGCSWGAAWLLQGVLAGSDGVFGKLWGAKWMAQGVQNVGKVVDHGVFGGIIVDFTATHIFNPNLDKQLIVYKIVFERKLCH